MTILTPVSSLDIEGIVQKVLYRLYPEETSGEISHRKEIGKVPIGVSNRHLHLSKDVMEQLFGKKYELKKRNPLYQPGEFAAEETVTLVGPKMRAIERVRILGPLRDKTQVEVSQTDAINLGIRIPVRKSGDTAQSAPITIVGPKGSVFLEEGLILAQRHIHMSSEDASRMNLVDNQVVQVRAGKEKMIVFDGVLIRVKPTFKTEMHVDTDEANSAGITCGMTGMILG